MSNVLAFPDRGDGPYLEGAAKCVGCKHEWRAVTPTGEFEGLECPACHASKGVRLGFIMPEDYTVWECECEGTLFYLTTSGAPLCANCGLRATSWAEG